MNAEPDIFSFFHLQPSCCNSKFGTNVVYFPKMGQIYTQRTDLWN